MNMSMSAAQRTKDENRKMWAFSGLWKPGETWYVFYPLANFDGQPDIIVNQTWGYSISDIKGFGLGRKFIPILTENNEKPKEATLLHKFAKLSRCFITGWYEKELAKIDNNTNLSEAQRKRKLKDINDLNEKKQPLLSNLKLIITTECFMVQSDSEGVPKKDTARLASQELSPAKIKSLKKIMELPIYSITSDQKYLQVMYAFGNDNDKKEAGKVDPQGISPEQLLEKKYPDIYNILISTLEGLASTSDLIAKRNPDFNPVDERDLLRAMEFYTVDQTEFLEAIESEDKLEILQDQASTLKELGVKHLKNVDFTAIEINNAHDEISQDEIQYAIDENTEERAIAGENEINEMFNIDVVNELASAI